MKHIELPMIELFGMAATRGLLGAGMGLILGEKLTRDHRRLAGRILAGIGLLSTVPFAYDVLKNRRLPMEEK
jgi:hypothetical protein